MKILFLILLFLISAAYGSRIVSERDIRNSKIEDYTITNSFRSLSPREGCRRYHHRSFCDDNRGAVNSMIVKHATYHEIETTEDVGCPTLVIDGMGCVPDILVGVCKMYHGRSCEETIIRSGASFYHVSADLIFTIQVKRCEDLKRIRDGLMSYEGLWEHVDYVPFFKSK